MVDRDLSMFLILYTMEPAAGDAAQGRAEAVRRLRRRRARRRAVPARRNDHLPARSRPYTFQIYLAIHVISAVVWVGGDVTLTTLGIVFERREDGETLAALGRMGTWIGTRSTRRRCSS